MRFVNASSLFNLIPYYNCFSTEQQTRVSIFKSAILIPVELGGLIRICKDKEVSCLSFLQLINCYFLPFFSNRCLSYEH